MVKSAVLVNRLACELCTQLFEYILVYGGQNNGGVHLTSVKCVQLFKGKSGCGIIDSAHCKGDKNLVCVKSGVAASKVLGLEVLDRCDSLGGDKLYLVVDVCKMLKSI